MSDKDNQISKTELTYLGEVENALATIEGTKVKSN